jgi:hypothetical protein
MIADLSVVRSAGDLKQGSHHTSSMFQQLSEDTEPIGGTPPSVRFRNAQHSVSTSIRWNRFPFVPQIDRYRSPGFHGTSLANKQSGN